MSTFKYLGTFLIVPFFIIKVFGQLEPLPQPAYFDVQIDRFEQVESDKSIVDFRIRVRKVNKTRSLIGEVVIGKPSGDDIMFSAKCFKKQGNEYRLMPYRLPPQPMCQLLKHDGKEIL